MAVIGILAYGSLIDDPGEDILRLLVKRVNTITPFPVEYARESRSRTNAPTLIPFDSGLRVRAQILVLQEGTTVATASNLLYQRETRTEKPYERPAKGDINNNTVLIEAVPNFENVHTVLYTKIGSNIPTLSANYLATNAIVSARSVAGENRRDGISYLINAKRNGIETPLSGTYEQEILRMTSTLSLEEAYDYCRNGRAT